MEIKNIESFIKNYLQFKDYLDKKLKNPPSIIKPEECYLINNDWIDSLLSEYEKFNNGKNNNLFYNKLNDFSKIKNPIFISNILETYNNFIDCHKKCTIISRKIIEDFFKNLIDEKAIFFYYIGNNKLIIENPKRDDYYIVLSNPLDDNSFKRNGIIVQSNKTNKKEEFEKYLKIFNIEFGKIEENKVIYNNKLNNDNIGLKLNSNESSDIILKISILLFYYEKYLVNPDNKFSIYQKYYIINYKWMNEFKKNIKYQEIFKLLKINDNKQKKKIEYININIDSFSKNFLKESLNENNKIDINFSFFNETFEQDASVSLFSDNIPYYTNCYIIHYKIIDLIKKIYNIKIVNSYKVASTNKNVFLFLDKNNLNIGIFNKQLLFENKYIINYNSNEISENEKNIILNTKLNEYFKINNCNEKDETQNLIENKIYKGKLIIINSSTKDNLFNHNKNNLLKKNNEDNNNEKIENSKYIIENGNNKNIKYQYFTYNKKENPIYMSLNYNQNVKKNLNNIEIQIEDKNAYTNIIENKLNNLNLELEKKNEENERNLLQLKVGHEEIIKEKEEYIESLKEENKNLIKKQKEIMEELTFLKNNVNQYKQIIEEKEKKEKQYMKITEEKDELENQNKKLTEDFNKKELDYNKII